MSLYFRPATFLPVRYAPAVFRCPTYQQPAFYPATRDIFSLFDDTFSQLEAIVRHQQQQQQQAQFKRPFSPKFNIQEQDKTYFVQGELPGFDAKDVSIEFLDEGHTLQIKGKTVSESSNKPETTATSAAAVESVEAAKTTEQSETTSVKSHQATVEDVAEASDAPAQSEAAPTQEVTKTETAPAPKQEEPKNHIVERYTGTFTRTFRFADKVDQEAVKASLKDGILAITLPFARKPESRRINIE